MSIDRSSTLASIEISGEPFDMGATLGRFGARVVHEHLIRTQAWATVIAHRNDPRVLRMAQQVEERFPQYWAELQGLAQGLELPVDETFAWNCRGDIWAMAPDGCTTVQVPGALSQGHAPDQHRVIAHNEDGDPDFRGHCAIARATPTQGTGFTAFAYPGSLPGHTFAATDSGIVQTVNNIRALDVGDGLPRMVLTRAVLDCQSLDAAVSLLRTCERAGAFHLTLAQVGDPRLLSVEFCAQSCSVHAVEAPSVHANHLIHEETASIRQIVTDSSASRQRRGNELTKDWQADQDPLMVLRDKAGPGLPIRRDDPQDPDHENTLATAVFSIDDTSIDWSIFDQADAPACFSTRERVVSAA